LDRQHRNGNPADSVDIDRWHDDLANSAYAKSPGRSTEKAIEAWFLTLSCTAFMIDRQVDVRCRQEIIRRERTHEKSRSCVTSAAALISNALAA
jgi:hypothetical protein